MRITDEEIYELAYNEYPMDTMSTIRNNLAFRNGAKRIRDIYEKHISRMALEMQTMQGMIDTLREELKEANNNRKDF